MENDILLFDNQKEYIDLLTDTQAGQLLKAIYAHNRGEETSFTDPMVQMAFMVFWKGISNGRAKRAKLRSNGSKGGRPKTNDKPNDNQTETKEEPTANQNESLNLNLKCDLNFPPISSNEDIPPKGGKPAKRKKEKEDLTPIILEQPEELRELLTEYVKIRNGGKKPISAYALRLALKRLYEIEPVNVTVQQAIIEQTIRNNWSDFYPLKSEQKAQPHGQWISEAERRQMKNNEVCRQVAEEIANGGGPF